MPEITEKTEKQEYIGDCAWCGDPIMSTDDYEQTTHGPMHRRPCLEDKREETL